MEESRMPGNPLVRFDEGRVGRTTRCRPDSYSTDRNRTGGILRVADDSFDAGSTMPNRSWFR
jgi:hypothetical protein